MVTHYPNTLGLNLNTLFGMMITEDIT
jgi:hypothetical protein